MKDTSGVPKRKDVRGDPYRNQSRIKRITHGMKNVRFAVDDGTDADSETYELKREKNELKRISRLCAKSVMHHAEPWPAAGRHTRKSSRTERRFVVVQDREVSPQIDGRFSPEPRTPTLELTEKVFEVVAKQMRPSARANTDRPIDHDYYSSEVNRLWNAITQYEARLEEYKLIIHQLTEENKRHAERNEKQAGMIQSLLNSLGQDVFAADAIQKQAPILTWLSDSSFSSDADTTSDADDDVDAIKLDEDSDMSIASPATVAQPALTLSSGDESPTILCGASPTTLEASSIATPEESRIIRSEECPAITARVVDENYDEGVAARLEAYRRELVCNRAREIVDSSYSIDAGMDIEEQISCLSDGMHSNWTIRDLPSDSCTRRHYDVGSVGFGSICVPQMLPDL